MVLMLKYEVLIKNQKINIKVWLLIFLFLFFIYPAKVLHYTHTSCAIWFFRKENSRNCTWLSSMFITFRKRCIFYEQKLKYSHFSLLLHSLDMILPSWHTDISTFWVCRNILLLIPLYWSWLGHYIGQIVRPYHSGTLVNSWNEKQYTVVM